MKTKRLFMICVLPSDLPCAVLDNLHQCAIWLGCNYSYVRRAWKNHLFNGLYYIEPVTILDY